jgi:hypothetical protein
MANPLATYLETPHDSTAPANDSLPTRKEWVEFCDFELKGSRLCFSDSWCPYDGVMVGLPAGTYAVTALCYSYGADVRVAALRVAPKGVEGALGEPVGEFGVDVGAAGITDFDQIEKLDEKSYEAWIEGYIHTGTVYQPAGVHPCPQAGTAMPFLSCGFGDGGYSVYPILRDGQTVGAEARFLEEDAPYPFGPQDGAVAGQDTKPRWMLPLWQMGAKIPILGVLLVLCMVLIHLVRRVFRGLVGRGGE